MLCRQINWIEQIKETFGGITTQKGMVLELDRVAYACHYATCSWVGITIQYISRTGASSSIDMIIFHVNWSLCCLAFGTMLRFCRGGHHAHNHREEMVVMRMRLKREQSHIVEPRHCFHDIGKLYFWSLRCLRLAQNQAFERSWWHMQSQVENGYPEVTTKERTSLFLQVQG